MQILIEEAITTLSWQRLTIVSMTTCFLRGLAHKNVKTENKHEFKQRVRISCVTKYM